MKTPLKAVQSDALIEILDSNDMSVAVVYGYPVPPSNKKRIAERIVECVNACANVKSEHLKIHADKLKNYDNLVQAVQESKELLNQIKSGRSQNTLKAMVILEEVLKTL